MYTNRVRWLVAVLISACVFAAVISDHGEEDHRKTRLASARLATPVANICFGVPYTVVIAPLATPEPPGMFDAISDRINQLQNDELILSAIAPLTRDSEGNLTVDLRLEADSKAEIMAILTTPAVLHIVSETAFDVGFGTVIPTGEPLSPVVENSDVDDAYVIDLPDQSVLRLVLTGPGVQRLSEAIAEAPLGADPVAVLIDRRLMESRPVAAPAPTAVDLVIDDVTLPRATGNHLAVALRAGPLPGLVQATFTERGAEDGCLG